MLLSILMYALWSSVFAFGKVALAYGPPLFLTACRMLLASAIILPFLAWKNLSSFRLSGRQLFSITILGFLSIYLTNVLEFWSLQSLSAAKTCFLYSLSPFLAAFLSYLHFGEKMNRRKWIGMTLGFTGIFPVLLMQKDSGELLSSFLFLSWPEIAMFGAVIASVYGWILLRLLVKDSSVSPPLANGISMLIGGLIALAHSWIADSWHPLPVAQGNLAPFFENVAIMTVISNVICYNLYGFLLKKFTATLLSFLGLLSPVFASLTSWLLLGEAPSLTILASTAVVLLGLWLIYSAELKQGYVAKARA